MAISNSQFGTPRSLTVVARRRGVSPVDRTDTCTDDPGKLTAFGADGQSLKPTAQLPQAAAYDPSPVGIVWGDLDPVAVHDMAVKLVEARPGTPLATLDGVGHYPMVEAPERFAAAVLDLLDHQLV